MKSEIRICKRANAGDLQSSLIARPENSRRQSDRAVVNAVKNWIAELAERKCANEHSVLFRIGARPHPG